MSYFSEGKLKVHLPALFSLYPGKGYVNPNPNTENLEDLLLISFIRFCWTNIQ